ncbi:MAG TPA: hypothetical protein VHD56_03980 [Tepidisphaeraceae bacterium]|nr:hypothetical protein [Tepidisphaeraceae bacterium]
MGGAECYVIEAVADSGKYTLWFDPSHSYNIAKAEMRKGPTDLYMGKPLGERRDASGKLLGEQSTEYIFSMETLRFAQDGNIWVPAEASIMCEQNFSTGRTFSEKAHHVRNVVEINRVLDPAVFVAAFPDHTRAFDTDVASGIQWVWNQGKFSPDVDEEAVAAVEQTARQINTDPILANESSDGGSPFNFRSWALICAALVGALSLLIWQLRYRQSRIS